MPVPWILKTFCKRVSPSMHGTTNHASTGVGSDPQLINCVLKREGTFGGLFSKYKNPKMKHSIKVH